MSSFIFCILLFSRLGRIPLSNPWQHSFPQSLIATDLVFFSFMRIASVRAFKETFFSFSFSYR